jgi:hypothetical protein
MIVTCPHRDTSSSVIADAHELLPSWTAWLAHFAGLIAYGGLVAGEKFVSAIGDNADRAVRTNLIVSLRRRV